MLGNRLSPHNQQTKNSLINKIFLFNELIKPGFNFSKVTRENNPQDFFAGLILNKFYSLNISIENSILNNDVFLSIYLYRYLYELYVKTFYIHSANTSTEQLLRLNCYYANRESSIKDQLAKINPSLLPPNFSQEHSHKYGALSKFVHPNLESLKLHLNRTDDQQFEFIVPNIELSIWHSVEVIRLLARKELLLLHKNLDISRIESIQHI